MNALHYTGSSSNAYREQFLWCMSTQLFFKGGAGHSDG